MEIDFSLREWEILRFFGFIARNEKNTQKWMLSEERDSKKPNILPDSFLGVFIWTKPKGENRTQILQIWSDCRFYLINPLGERIF